MASSNPCSVLDALAKFQFDVISRLNKKFNALRRIAELLEQIGDLTVLIPNIESLIPTASISLEMYQRLVQDCPFLGLPPASDANLDELRQKVIAAYAALISKLQNFAHFRMGKLQSVLTRFQADLNASAAIANDYITCLQTICDTLGSAASAFQNIAHADVKKEIAAYTQNFVANAGQVMTAGMKVKADQVNTTIAQIKTLSTETVADVQATGVQATVIIP